MPYDVNDRMINECGAVGMRRNSVLNKYMNFVLYKLQAQRVYIQEQCNYAMLCYAMPCMKCMYVPHFKPELLMQVTSFH
jgi:hypothetical protein